MNQNIEYSLSEVLSKIDSKLDKLENKIDSKFNDLSSQVNDLSKDVNSMKIDIATLKEGQNGLNKRLDDWKPIITKNIDKTDNLSEKVGELKNWRQIAIIIVTALITSLFWIFRNQIFTF